MRMLPCLLLAALCPAAELPITGLAHAGFLTSDIEKARRFYTGVLGYEEAFSIGPVVLFKINDEQFIEVFPGLKPEENLRMSHIGLLTPDARKLRAMLAERGLAPTGVAETKAGNLTFEIKDPDGMRIEFLQYLPGSLHSRDRGRHLGARRISEHLWHAGVLAANAERALAFYRDKLGFVETWRGGPTDTEVRWINLRMPGERGDYLELMLYSEPPSRRQIGSMLHICLEVPAIPPGYESRVGRNGRRQVNLFDPDGSRVEIMESSPVPSPQSR